MTKALRISLKVLNGVITAVLILVIIANIYTLIARKATGSQNVTVFGLSSAVVLTGSMSEAIELNDMIITKSQKSYSVGDIVMYEGNSTTVTHRIIEITDNGYLTKGDANNTDDGTPIPKEKIVGKVIVIIPKIGSLISFFTTPLGMLILVLVLFSSVELPNFINRKNQRRGETETNEK